PNRPITNRVLYQLSHTSTVIDDLHQRFCSVKPVCACKNNSQTIRRWRKFSYPIFDGLSLAAGI
ncbi:MAG: hypothetical protein ACPH4L_10720, partial [Candidatus Puniceispirillaceae bacterium]